MKISESRISASLVSAKCRGGFPIRRDVVALSEKNSSAGVSYSVRRSTVIYIEHIFLNNSIAKNGLGLVFLCFWYLNS